MPGRLTTLLCLWLSMISLTTSQRRIALPPLVLHDEHWSPYTRRCMYTLTGAVSNRCFDHENRICSPLGYQCNCWWQERSESLDCTFARLHVYLDNLQLPGATKRLSCTHSSINNATAFKAQVLDRTDELQVIKLAYNEIEQLPTDFFATNPQLTDINLRNNKLTDISANLFKHQTKLEKLDLSNNQIRTISEGAFLTNIKLRTIEIWKNQLETLPENLFSRNFFTQRIKTIINCELAKLAGEYQKCFDMKTGSLSNLEKLSASSNKLQSLPEKLFAHTTSLKYLLLVRNHLKCLPSNIFKRISQVQMTKTKDTFKINLGLNQLRELPDDLLKYTPALRTIRLWANHIECLPKALFNNTKRLEYVNLLLGNRGVPLTLRQRFSKYQSYNNMDKLRDKLAKLGNDTCGGYRCDWDPHTATLDCSYRNLSSVKEIEDVCGTVRNMKLNGNQLNDSNEIGSLLNRHPHVRNLELQDNRLKGKLDENMFRKSDFLSFLDLSSNFIDQLPENLLRNNLLLQEVRMHRNSIESLSPRIFGENDAIEKVDFSNNRMRQLPGKMFVRNSALQEVDFSQNYIETLDDVTFANNVKLRTIDLSGNQLSGRLDLSPLNNATQLTLLKLNGNRLREIIYESPNESGLKSGNKTKEISLSTNRLTQFPTQLIKSAPSAEKINLQRNEISVLPEDAFSSNLHLLSIDLSNNKLHRLQTLTFDSNLNLEELILDGNSLSELPAQLLHRNQHLRVFSAAGNRLTSLPVNTFWRSPYLEEVRFSNNHLGVGGLPGNLFAGSPRLSFASFGGNSLTYLPEALFQGTPNLSQVYLQKNDLQSVHPSTFRSRQGLSDQSLLSMLTNIEETDSAGLEELLDENLSENESNQEPLLGIIKLDLRDNPRLGRVGMEYLFSGRNVSNFFNMLDEMK